MSRPDLIKNLKKKYPELNQLELETVIDDFCESLEKALINGNNIELRGFGTFFIKKIKEKFSARNPQTQELIYSPEKNKLRFRPSKKLNKFINQ